VRIIRQPIRKTHGNTTIENTKINAARCLHAFAAPEHVKVYVGAVAPLLRPARHDAEIHGEDGLRGVEGLPPADSDWVRARIASDNRPAIEAIAAAISQTWNAGEGAKVTVVASGPLTNIALFVSVYPHLLDAIERIVFMGGGIGIGNRSAVAGAAVKFQKKKHNFSCQCQWKPRLLFFFFFLFCSGTVSPPASSDHIRFFLNI
jgi:uridine nucleosidase